ncbi:hypothetical protein Lsed01_01866 [Demequina sediminis]|uniref:HTH tetR-type domain-containing protein n=1 Tax=Demequina sediminis TaxID=1930058 RepID=A0ABP9WKT7_9MICO|nr:TetR/AcrR family transcriptional regulator [Demequina sediminis]BDZ61675.1 hypothetical protein GCM10025873_14660 [Demequina sediminis]
MTNDPRFTRSADALAAAVLALAAERPIERISVTEIARHARVTRATFYNHATSPSMLLTRTLEAELDRIRSDFLEEVTADPGEVERIWRDSELSLVQHLLAHAAVYRCGLAPAEGAHGSVLAALLASHLEGGLLAYADASGMRAAGSDLVRLEMAAAFVSQGTVGALRAWLLSPEPHDPHFAVDTIVGFIPAMWFALARD